jgi:hypothetical protein
MMLAISSAAAPGLPLAELLEVCVRRGLAGAELQAADGAAALAGWRPGGTATRGDPSDAAAGARLLAYRVRSLAEAVEQGALDLAARSGAAVIVPALASQRAAIERVAAAYHAAGARLLLSHGSDVGAVAALREVLERTAAGGAPGLAWDVRPGVDAPDAVRAVVAEAGEHLAHVRLFGGGPESVSQTGHGVGALMARLTLARFRGPLVLTPSTPRYHEAWGRWLGRNGGWGCGSKHSDPSLVQISA